MNGKSKRIVVTVEFREFETDELLTTSSASTGLHPVFYQGLTRAVHACADIAIGQLLAPDPKPERA